MFERIGDDGFQNSARCAQSQFEFSLFHRATAVGVGLFENLAQFRVVDEFEPAGWDILRRDDYWASVIPGKGGDGLREDIEQALDDLLRSRSFRGASVC